jgi:hypothetical protein
MPDPKKPADPAEDEKKSLFDDDDDATEYSNPRKDLPFKPEGIPEEDDEATVAVPPDRQPPPKKR